MKPFALAVPYKDYTIVCTLYLVSILNHKCFRMLVALVRFFSNGVLQMQLVLQNLSVYLRRLSYVQIVKRAKCRNMYVCHSVSAFLRCLGEGR